MRSSQASGRRVVITGMGLVCPLGSSLDSYWEALTSRTTGIRPLESLPTGGLPVRVGGEARQFTGHIDDFGQLDSSQKKAIRKGLKTICREAQMGIAAAQLALQHGGLSIGDFEPHRTGAVFGSDYMITVPDEFREAVRKCIGTNGKFDYSLWATTGKPLLNPLWLLKYLPNMPAGHLAIYNDLRGPSNSITQREASANLAVGEAAEIIIRGQSDRMVAGATGTWVHPTKTIHAVLQSEVVENGVPAESACRPFDRGRQGMVPGEGSAAIILEELETARARGATIWGEVIGAGSCQVASRHLVANRQQAMTQVMQAALRDAEMQPNEIGHVHAHGLSARQSDIEEATAIGNVFGAAEQAPPVVAAKSYFGNLGAGSGMVEIIGSLLALQHDRLFPILNYETPDPECPVHAVTSDDVAPGDSFLNVNVTMLGQAGAVVIRRFES